MLTFGLRQTFGPARKSSHALAARPLRLARGILAYARQVRLKHSTNSADRPGASATMSRGHAARGMLMKLDGYRLVRTFVLLGLVLAPLTAQAQPASDGVTEEKVKAA